MATKRSAKKSLRKKRAKSKGKARRKTARTRKGVNVVLAPGDHSVSPFARRALRHFRRRVTEALEDFGNRQIEVTVQTRDGIVRAVPRRQDGTIVVNREPRIADSDSRRAARH